MKANRTTIKKFRIQDIPSLLKSSALAWYDSDPFRLSAIIAYYAVLSMPALIVIIVNLLGIIWGNDEVAERISNELNIVLGQDSAYAVTTMLENSRNEESSTFMTIIGIASLLYGATGVFYQLQISLNSIWKLKVDPQASWKSIVIDRILSFGFVLVLGFLLLISFVLSTLLTALNERLKAIFPDTIIIIVQISELIVSLGVVTLLFAFMFRFLPHSKIKWRSVWVGAIFTSVLFALGKYALGIYFSHAEPASTYGAAGSVILLLLWVSYASLILFFGAEITFAFATQYGEGINPTETAIVDSKAKGLT